MEKRRCERFDTKSRQKLGDDEMKKLSLKKERLVF